MEEFMLSDDIYEQIKDFNYKYLTDEQSLLIDKLILYEGLKERYKWNGLCNECKHPKASDNWCQHNFQQNFKNWTSGNNEVDKFIQKAQLKAKNYKEILEWIEYDKFEMLNIWPKEDLELFIKQFGKMDIYLFGILKITNGKEVRLGVRNVRIFQLF
jgi:hypothetical protein